MKVRKFQQGGQASMGPEAQQAAPEQGGQDPIMEIASAMQEGLANQDCGMLAQACQAFLGLLQQAQGGAPMPAPGEGQEPVFKKGGKLVRRKCSKKQDGGAFAAAAGKAGMPGQAI